MKNCNHCNAVISDDTVQCPYCNTRIDSNATFQQPQQTCQPRINETAINQNNSRKRGISIFEIFLFVVFGMPFISMICVFLMFGLLGILSNVTTQPPVETTIDGGVIQEDGSVVYSHELTLEKIVELSEQGYNLSWEHFGIYDFVEQKYDKKTGYEMIRYKIEDDCHTRYLVISGVKENKPDSMLFYDSYGDSFGNEIRDTQEFMKHKKTLEFDSCLSY